MKILSMTALAAVLSFSTTSVVSAATTGAFVGVGIGANDPFGGAGVLSDADISNYDGDPFSTPALYKCDEIEGEDVSCTDENGSGGIYGDYTDAFTITFDTFKEDEPGEWLTGTWMYSPTGDETRAPAYIVLKSGTQGWAVWDISGLTTGTWDVTDAAWGNTQAISHISFYDTSTTVIPLPAAGWLLLAGLGGLAAYGRKKRWA